MSHIVFAYSPMKKLPQIYLPQTTTYLPQGILYLAHFVVECNLPQTNPVERRDLFM